MPKKIKVTFDYHICCLQTPANVCLRVATNSTRRARWFTRLGFHSKTLRPMCLRDVLSRGGSLPALTAVVARTYPLLFLEKINGKTGQLSLLIMFL